MPVKTASESSYPNITQQMGKLMDQLNRGYYNYRPGETWVPNVNLYETPEGYLVCVDISGVEKEKIDVEIIDQRLRLRGARPVPVPGDSPGAPGKHLPRLRVHLMEIDHGAFCREVELPMDVAKEAIKANYRDGMLWIELPKK